MEVRGEIKSQLSHNFVLCLITLACLASTGCMGGRSVRMTRQSYNEAVLYTAKQEMLLNIVRLKYREPPEFMALSNINEQLEYSGNGGAEFSPFGISVWSLGASTGESPNFTYAPLESDEFNRRLNSPLPKDVLDLLGATNWSPGHLLRLTVKAINDVDNASTAGGPTPELAPDFRHFKVAMDILDDLHATRHVEITHVSGKDQSSGLSEKKIKRPIVETGPSSSSANQQAVSDWFDNPIVNFFRKESPSETEKPATDQPDLVQLLQSITKSDLDQKLDRMSDADAKKLILERLQSGKIEKEQRLAIMREVRRPSAKESAKVTQSAEIRKLLEEILIEQGEDPEPFAKKLTEQIRDGLKPEKEATDQVVLRFTADALNFAEVKFFQEIFDLVEASEDYPFYNFQRADWGQLRRRDQKEKAKGSRYQAELWASPRSFLEVLYFVSQGVCVPPEHYNEGLVTVTRNYDGSVFDWSEVTGDLLTVCVSKHKPRDASTVVQYKGYWYYIQDNDLQSKSTFSLLIQMYNMAVRSGAVGQVPQLTIAR